MSKPSTITYQSSSISNRKVAITTDWAYGGGSEKVVEQLHKLYPEAPIYTSYCSDDWRQQLDNKVITGYLQRTPFKQLRKFLPLLRQWWFAHLDLSDFDLVISVTGNGEAKFVRVPNGKHISYCNTPVHYYWRHYDRYLQDPGFKPAWLARLGLKLFVRPLRRRDYKAAQKVDVFIANSSHIGRDIKKFYGRESTVIFPPVDTSRFKSGKLIKKHTGFITVGRQVPLKKIDVIVEACKQLRLPLTVVGNGPEHSSLVANTGPTIHFRTDVTDEELPDLVTSSEAFLFASFEDFGIVAIEAMAAGTPVIAFKAGGALDYIVPGKTGEFFDRQTPESLAKVLEGFDAKKFKPSYLQDFAETFGAKHFRKNIRDFVANLR